jgi:tetratricopeptide (TPR) repeat protein
MRTHSFRGVLALAVLLTWTAVPASAQSIVRGTVVDGNGAPVEGATVLFEAEGTTRRMETKTNRSGEFLQIGLTSGAYKVTASKDGVGTQTLTTQVMQRENAPLSFRISPAAAAPAGEANKEALAIQAAAGSALDAMRAGRYDEAIASFNEVLLKVPTCAECYYNIGLAHSNKREFADAESSFLKALELDPKSADAYTGLANIYNAQRKFEEAAEASAKAAELAGGGVGANAEAIYNQGVIHWNAGRFEEAKTQFEAAVQADPKMAMAYYQLGMANLNMGNIPAAREAFEKYLEVEPNGPKSAEVKVFVEQLPQ